MSNDRVNGSLRLRLHEENGQLRGLLVDGEGSTVARGEMSVALRLPDRASHPVFIRTVDELSSDGNVTHVSLSADASRYRVKVAIEHTGGGPVITASASAPTPIWMLEWRLDGFDVDEIIVPALGGQVVTRAMPPEQSLAYKYPFWWNAQFAIGTRPGGGVVLRTEDVHPTMKVLRLMRQRGEAGGFNLGLAFEADAPLETNALSASWSIESFKGDWRNAVEIHRTWMESAFGLVPRDRHARRPEWVEEIDFVLEMWGMRGDRGRPGHTFDDMIERIEAFAQMHSPETTLVYLPGFAEEGIDTNAPSYDPAPMCGGDVAFSRLVNRAHELGYRVMIHTNVLAMTFSHPRFNDFEDKQVVDPFGRPQGWGMDIDGDWLAEPFFAYINPGHAEWGELMSGILGELINRYGLDAVFIDQTLLAFNDSNGPNFMIGMREHIQRLQRDHPHVLFAGEGLHEQVLSALPVAQIHGLDSIADVHGMEGTAEWRTVHPVSVELFSKYTHFLPHLLTRHPSNAAFERQEEAYANLGIMPALVLYDRDQEMEGPATESMIARARSLRKPRTGDHVLSVGNGDQT